jgi:CRISPR-associated exonuclease Cas4
VFEEDELLPISALQHLLFCERQCALIHLERVWLDNALTVEGTYLHRRADEGPVETRRDLVIARAVPLRSLRLGISGRADVIEFALRGADSTIGAVLPGRPGRWLPRPVEYKRGRPKSHRADEVQLCAQGLCIEEMMKVEVTAGDLYYGARRRRTAVVLDNELRGLTTRTIDRLHALMRAERLPAGRLEPKCERCSLRPACMPEVQGSARTYLRRELSRGGVA